MAENWQQGMVTEVYYNYGRFNNDQGKKRFVRAPFVLIKFQPVTDAAWDDFSRCWRVIYIGPIETLDTAGTVCV